MLFKVAFEIYTKIWDLLLPKTIQTEFSVSNEGPSSQRWMGIRLKRPILITSFQVVEDPIQSYNFRELMQTYTVNT